MRKKGSLDSATNYHPFQDYYVKLEKIDQWMREGYLDDEVFLARSPHNTCTAARTAANCASMIA